MHPMNEYRWLLNQLLPMLVDTYSLRSLLTNAPIDHHHIRFNLFSPRLVFVQFVQKLMAR